MYTAICVEERGVTEPNKWFSKTPKQLSKTSSTVPHKPEVIGIVFIVFKLTDLLDFRQAIIVKFMGIEISIYVLLLLKLR